MRQLPNILEQIKEAEAMLRELKNRQLVGQSSLLGYKVISSNQYDLEIVASDPITRFRITYNYTSARGGALVDCKPFYSLTTTDVFDNSYISDTSYEWSVFVETEEITDTYTTFIMAVYSKVLPTVTTGWVKFVFDGTDSGNWAVEAI